MHVFLVRHAKSFYDWTKYPTDAVRPLSEKGIKRQKMISETMKHFDMVFDEAWVSPYVRAQETLSIIQVVYKVDVPITVINELVPGGDEEKVLELLQAQAQKTPTLKLILVSHNPLISDLVCLIEPNSMIDMRTSEVTHCVISEATSGLVKYYTRDELMKSK